MVIVLTTNLEPGDLGDPIPTNSESYYIALSGAATAGTTSVMIGTEETESFKGVSYSNQKLEGGIFYAAVRAYSEVVRGLPMHVFACVRLHCRDMYVSMSACCIIITLAYCSVYT